MTAVTYRSVRKVKRRPTKPSDPATNVNAPHTTHMTHEFMAWRLNPPQERHNIPGNDPDRAVVADDHILGTSTLGCGDRCCRLPKVVAAAAGDITRQPLPDTGQRNRQAHDPQRQPESLPDARSPRCSST